MNWCEMDIVGPGDGTARENARTYPFETRSCRGTYFRRVGGEPGKSWWGTERQMHECVRNGYGRGERRDRKQ